MKIGVLTAALQELTPRDVRDADPDRAVEDWIQFAHEPPSNDSTRRRPPSESDVRPQRCWIPWPTRLDLRKPSMRRAPGG